MNSPNNPYDFQSSKAAGDEGEAFLDRFLEGKGYTVTPVSDTDQRQNKIDRKLRKQQPDGKVIEMVVEYKSDYKTNSTGNIFIETTSNEAASTPGWLFASKADWIITYVPDKYVLAARLSVLRDCYYKMWARKYHRLPVENKPKQPGQSYYTIGFAVPVADYIKATNARCEYLGEKAA